MTGENVSAAGEVAGPARTEREGRIERARMIEREKEGQREGRRAETEREERQRQRGKDNILDTYTTTRHKTKKQTGHRVQEETV